VRPHLPCKSATVNLDRFQGRAEFGRHLTVRQPAAYHEPEHLSLARRKPRQAALDAVPFGLLLQTLAADGKCIPDPREKDLLVDGLLQEVESAGFQGSGAATEVGRA